jgi:hypothetical protein
LRHFLVRSLGLSLALVFGATAQPPAQSRPDSPPAVARPSAFFRSGQTFLTWPQIPLEGVRYRIYRSGVPIATVHDRTSLNLMASINRLQLSNTRPPAGYEIPERVYFVTREGAAPLDPQTGLFVYTAKAQEEPEYQVAAVSDGLEGARSEGVRIREKVEMPQPVRQNELDYVHWTDNVGTPHYPAMSSLPSVPYNFRLRAPTVPGPHPLIAFLHGAFLQYSNADMGGDAESGAVRIAFDSPMMRGKIKNYPQTSWPAGAWYGYNENFGTGKPIAEGKVQDYVARRVLWTLAWAERTFPIDPDRVSVRGGSMGGIGALVLGLLHPARFAAVHAFIPPLRMARGSSMMPVVPADYIRRHPDTEFPYLIYTAGRTDDIVGWPDKLEFAAALREAKLGFTFYWDLRGHTQTYTGPVPSNLNEPPVPWGRTPERPQVSVTAFSRNQSFPAIANLSVDSDPGTVNFAVRPAERPPLESPGAGDLIGTFNGSVTWDRASITDTAERWEISMKLMPFVKTPGATASVTPRRLQRFKPRPGQPMRWEVIDNNGQRLTNGEAVADAMGRLTIAGVPLTLVGTRLRIWTAGPSSQNLR